MEARNHLCPTQLAASSLVLIRPSPAAWPSGRLRDLRRIVVVSYSAIVVAAVDFVQLACQLNRFKKLQIPINRVEVKIRLNCSAFWIVVLQKRQQTIISVKLYYISSSHSLYVVPVGRPTTNTHFLGPSRDDWRSWAGVKSKFKVAPSSSPLLK